METAIAAAGQGFWEETRAQFIQAFIEGDRWKLYLKGLGQSLTITIFALALGIILGLLVAVVRSAYEQRPKGDKGAALSIVNAIFKVYITVIRGTPMMVQLLIMGFVVFKSSRNYLLISVLTLGINSGAYAGEIFRSGIMSVDPGQMEAGRSLGLSYGAVMMRIVIPQAMKNILPALGNEMITLFKDTSLVSVIGMTELTKVARDVQSRTYQPLMPFLGIAAVYLVVVMILSCLLRILERRLRQSDRK